MQVQDPKLLAIVASVTSGHEKENYELKDRRLFKKINGKSLWVVPKSLRWKLLHENHDNAGHLGVEKTIERVQEKFWFARMRNFIKSYIKSCVACAYNKTEGGKTKIEYHYDDITPVPFKLVHIDHLGPFPKSRKGNEHIIVIIDAFTKFLYLKAVRNTSTMYVIEAIRDLSCYFGTPEVLVSDRGTAYTSKAFKKFCVDNGISHRLNAVRSPRANGQVERTNRTLLSMLKTMTADDRLWDGKIRELQWTLNSMKSSSTGRTPQELLYKFTPRNNLQNSFTLALHSDTTFSETDLQQQQKHAAD